MTEPLYTAERRDIAEEAAADAWQAMYDAILAERQEKGLADSPAVIVAEIEKRRREAREDAE